MNALTTSERSAFAITQTLGQLEAQQKAKGDKARLPPFTIAISREAGTNGQQIAEAVGKTLGWPVFDRELLKQLAEDLGVRPKLLEQLDERTLTWMEELLEGLSGTSVTQSAYVRRLVEAIAALATGGRCIILGRGAAQILSPDTTLRVRLTAPRAWRVQAMQERARLADTEAARRIDETDRNRAAFVEEHFHTDPREPSNYDLVVNCQRFTALECADLVVRSLQHLQAHGAIPDAAPSPDGA